ncbi:MAG: hypothetical protein EBV01_13930, partial [Betaproteobacteria bacterium]|nr:hypothetical protein [Betaproteobacteria bacterium]
MPGFLCDLSAKCRSLPWSAAWLIGLCIVTGVRAQTQDAALEQWFDHVEKTLQLPRSAIALALEPIEGSHRAGQALLPSGQGRFPGHQRSSAQRPPLRWQHRADEAMNP